MAPPRIVELQCPVCEGQHWIIDSDFRGTSGHDVPNKEREYVCSKCAHRGIGHRVLQKSPPEFFRMRTAKHPVDAVRRASLQISGSVLRPTWLA